MSDVSNPPKSLQAYSLEMKRDWDEHAIENAKWFINTYKLDQSDEEFYATGKPEVERFVLNDPLLTEGRDLSSLRLLEIGCGIGRMTRHLVDAFGEVHATDVSDEMIRQARARFENVKNAFFYESNGLDFSIFPDDCFDVIFSVYVFQHVPSVEAVLSNIADACRVLKPGGLFKFQVSGITDPEFVKLQKDTWTGVSLSEAEIRDAARQNGMRLISVTGAGSQYCWTILEKPIKTSIPSVSPVVQPEIRQISCIGDSRIKMIVAGLDPYQVDANTIKVELDGQEVLPHFVWKAVGESPSENLAQIEANVPKSIIGDIGELKVRVKGPDGSLSNYVSVKLTQNEPQRPHIHLVTNVFDGGLDLYAEGEKSGIRIFAHGITEPAAIENVRIMLGETMIIPQSVNFVPANNAHAIIFKLPGGTPPGEFDLMIQVRDLASDKKRIRIL